MLTNYEKFDLEFVKDLATIDITNRGFGVTLDVAGVIVGRELDTILNAIDVTSSETSVIRYSFNISSIANANTIVRRYRLAGYL